MRKALSASKGLDSTAIVVIARKGTVTLSGTVTDPSQIRLAQSVAEGAVQGKSIANNLTVREGGK